MNYLEVNKDAWDKRTKVHVDSKFYDVEGFLSGRNSLNQIELDEVGDVNGKALLHLQCHFGQDTMSWARLGAKVTGVDISSEAINVAKRLSDKLGLSTHFVCDDIYSFADTNDQLFDVVFVSYGALCWLPDLHRWADLVSSSLKEGGQLNLVEFHNFNDILSGYSYFPSNEADIDDEGTYTENCTGETSIMMTWPHPISEVINALIGAGLSVDSVNEFPYSPYNCFSEMEKDGDRGFKKLCNGQPIPLVYSIKARKQICL